MTRFLVLMLAVLAGGCVQRGTLDFDCRHFDTAIDGQRPFRTVLPASPLERRIRGEVISPEDRIAADQARRDEQADVAEVATAAAADSQGIEALLLSGGGQWGAFGAGFMSQLLNDGEFPDHLGLVTGVSTGALQALFVGAGLDRQASLQGRLNDSDWARRGMQAHRPPTYADLMRYEYRPEQENQIVQRNSQEASLYYGSMAGLLPLREVIENALCAHPSDDSTDCMIDDLASSNILTLVGFVDAEDGNFYYVNVNRIARSTDRYRRSQRARLDRTDLIEPAISRSEARQCIAAAAIASVAMPAFFQQVRVNRRTYYDGGVRRSVFADYAAGLANAANKQAATAVPSGGPKPPPVPPTTVYVLRNGPTSVSANEMANQPRVVWNTALRAEQVVVNELEVSSVAGLRLDYPQGPLMFRSADAWERFPYYDEALGSRTCQQRKGEGRMFDPDFMRCIMEYGALVARQQEVEEGPLGWRILPEILGRSPKIAPGGASAKPSGP